MHRMAITVIALALGSFAQAQEVQKALSEAVEWTEGTPAGDRVALPDAPKPKIETRVDENATCPAGNGKPCALLGGMRYFRDAWHMREHDRTWGDAMKGPAILGMAGFLTAATVLDVEGTNHCLKLHTCREVNPIMPRTPDRIQQYSLAMGINALAIYGLGKEKQHGRGNRAFSVIAALSLLHFYEGASGFADGATSASVKVRIEPAKK